MERTIKKIVVALFLLIIFMAASVTGVYAYIAPVKYVSLDINPSVELAINTFDVVIDAQAMNEDGETILEGKTVKNLSVEKAIDILVESAVEKDYIALDGSSVISVITEAEDEEKNEDLQEQCVSGVSLAMSNKNAIASLYKDSSDPALRQEARSLGISPGKYKLIKMLQVIDPTITVGAYKDAKVTEIIRKANELLIAGGYEGEENEETDETQEQPKATGSEQQENGNQDEQDINEENNQNKENKNTVEKDRQDESNTDNNSNDNNTNISKNENQSAKEKHANNGKTKK